MPPPKSFTEQLRQDPPQGTPALEEAFIIRFPKPIADEVRTLIDKDELGERLKIKMNSHQRLAEVDFLKGDKNSFPKNDLHFKGKLLDLPTVNEIYKSIDNKNMYKCTDLHQFVVLQEAKDFDAQQKEFEDPDDTKFDPEDPKQVAAHDKMYQYPHGMIPPFKNIRKTRFRKTAKRTQINAVELENDVKRLLRDDFDDNVVEVDFKIEYEDVDLDAIKEKAKHRKWHTFMRNTKKGIPNWGQPGWKKYNDDKIAAGGEDFEDTDEADDMMGNVDAMGENLETLDNQEQNQNIVNQNMNQNMNQDLNSQDINSDQLLDGSQMMMDGEITNPDFMTDSNTINNHNETSLPENYSEVKFEQDVNLSSQNDDLFGDMSDSDADGTENDSENDVKDELGNIDGNMDGNMDSIGLSNLTEINAKKREQNEKLQRLQYVNEMLMQGETLDEATERDLEEQREQLTNDLEKIGLDIQNSET